MNIKPIYDKVLLKLLEPQKKTSGGIYIPEEAQTKSLIALIVAVGEGKLNDAGQIVKPRVKEGQKVLIRGEWAGDNVTVEGLEYKIVSESDILAVIEE